MAQRPTNFPEKKSAASAVRSALGQQIQVQHGTQVFQGPSPHPDILAGFDKLVPGTAQRLIQLAEDESLHRRKMEQQAMSANVNAQKQNLELNEYQNKAVFKSDTIGQTFGLIVSLACIAGAIYLGLNNHQGTAIALAALPTAAVIRAFFINKHQQPTKPSK